MVQIGVLFAFVVYVYVCNRWGHRWRRLGLQSLEYVVGGALVVGATWLQLGRGAPPWLFWITVHYVLAWLIVLPADVARASRDTAEAARRDREE